MERKRVSHQDSLVFSLKSVPRRGRQVHIMPVSTSTVLVLEGRVRIGRELKGGTDTYLMM
jgi:hypothetical protein